MISAIFPPLNRVNDHTWGTTSANIRPNIVPYIRVCVCARVGVPMQGLFNDLATTRSKLLEPRARARNSCVRSLRRREESEKSTCTLRKVGQRERIFRVTHFPLRNRVKSNENCTSDVEISELRNFVNYCKADLLCNAISFISVWKVK